VWRIPGSAGYAQANPGPDGQADCLVVLRHGRCVWLSERDAGTIARHGRSGTVAGGSQPRARRFRGRGWHLLPVPQSRSLPAGGHPIRSIAGPRTGMTPGEVLDFWFVGDPTTHRKEWFEKSADFDASCGRFADALLDAKGGKFDHWAETPRGALALIVLLDQF